MTELPKESGLLFAARARWEGTFHSKADCRARQDPSEGTRMGRFYFHIRDGDQLIPDEEGQDLPDTSEALREATLAARQLLAEAIKSGRERVPDAFVIADEA